MELREELEELATASDPDSAIDHFEKQIKQLDQKIDDAGLHITVNGEERLLEVDNVVICAGQVPLRKMFDELKAAGVSVNLIGGADEASELDAKRAINQGARMAAAV